jgi:hypothetical protein
MYQITNYTKEKANELGVKVVNSKNPKKKIDVFKDEKKVASIGAIGYKDYPSYLKSHGKEYADAKRALYKIRHKRDINVVGSNGWYSSILLW